MGGMVLLRSVNKTFPGQIQFCSYFLSSLSLTKWFSMVKDHERMFCQQFKLSYVTFQNRPPTKGVGGGTTISCHYQDICTCLAKF